VYQPRVVRVRVLFCILVTIIYMIKHTEVQRLPQPLVSHQALPVPVDCLGAREVCGGQEREDMQKQFGESEEVREVPVGRRWRAGSLPHRDKLCCCVGERTCEMDRVEVIGSDLISDNSVIGRLGMPPLATHLLLPCTVRMVSTCQDGPPE